MRTIILAAAAMLSLAACGTTGGAKPNFIDAAIADPGRPKADVDRDIHRKPADMLKFAHVKPGSKIGELLPGGGYFTRIFSKAVGPDGAVYAVLSPPPPAVVPPPLAPGAVAPPAPAPRPPAPVLAIAADPAYANVKVVTTPFTELKLAEPVDLIWTSQNYHDIYLRPNADLGPVNRAVFAALKPGGIYIVLDHAARDGSGITDTSKLHRIDPAVVKADVIAAGFKFVGESKVLRNPADDHSKGVFDPTLRGETDQFVYKFKKP